MGMNKQWNIQQFVAPMHYGHCTLSHRYRSCLCGIFKFIYGHTKVIHVTWSDRVWRNNIEGMVQQNKPTSERKYYDKFSRSGTKYFLGVHFWISVSRSDEKIGHGFFPTPVSGHSDILYMKRNVLPPLVCLNIWWDCIWSIVRRKTLIACWWAKIASEA